MIYVEKGLLCQGHGGPGGTEQSASLENIDEYISEPQDVYKRQVYLLFERGEEGGNCIYYVMKYIQARKIRIDSCYAIHVDPDLPSGTFWIREGASHAGNVNFEIGLTGKGGHGSRPDLSKMCIRDRAAGMAFSLMIYNPVTGVIHNRFLFTLTPTGCSFLASGCIYWLLCNLPGIRRYVRRDLTEVPDPKPFDRFREPPRQNPVAMPFIWLWCYLVTARAGLKIRKKGMKGLKPPFLVLATHHSFTDFYVTPRVLFPHRANYVSELEGFENFGEWLYRQSGCLGTRKFVDDLALVKNICRVLGRGGILVLYPEARYANVGTNSKLPLAVAKLVKLCKVPVVTLNMKGNYLQSPIWNLRIRREARLEAEAELAYTAEEAKRAEVGDIYRKLSRLLAYDEYAWQRETGLRITDSFRAEGLHLPLYQCRTCGAVHRMASKGSELFCTACGACLLYTSGQIHPHHIQ